MALPVLAEDPIQEIFIYPKQRVHIKGVEVESRNALNMYAIKVAGSKWQVFSDQYTKLESASGGAVTLAEIVPGHVLEIKGSYRELGGVIEAALIRDLSIGVKPAEIAVSPPPASSPQKSNSESNKGSFLTKNLRLGMKGKEVVRLQEFLQKNGWGIPNDGPVTGHFGKVTKKAVENFQKANGLAAVGTVGPKTRELINALLQKE